ncbi:MAG: hypothetical protein ACOH2T_29315 [Pseudomonas sp.]
MKMFLFWSGVLIAVFAPVPLAIWLGSAKFGVLCFVSGTLAVLFSKIETLEELSVGPLKAKLRKAIDEANATVEQLRTLGSELSDATLSLLMATEFMNGMDVKAKFALHRKIIECLTNLGASDEQIQNAQGNWLKGVSVMYLRLIRQHVEGRESFTQRNLDVGADELAASSEIFAMSNFDIWHVPTPSEMRETLRKHSISNVVASEWISDYETFLKTSTIPRVDLFLSSQR